MSITYKVIKYTSRPYYVVRWRNGPPASPRGEKSTGCKSRRKATEWAIRFIGTMQAEGSPESVGWGAFRSLYEESQLVHLKSAASYRTVLNTVESIIAPRTVDDLTSEAIEAWQRTLVARGKSSATVASYSKHLRAVLKWAENRQVVDRSPIIKAGDTNQMRGRPLSLEEVERMLWAATKLLGNAGSQPVQRVIRAALFIGLRRTEFFRCYWDRDDMIMPSGLTGGTPSIHFPAATHKRGQDATIALSPDAVEMFCETPKRQRSGLIFLPIRGIRKQITTPDGLGRLIAAVGERAKVITQNDPVTGQKRYATMHDLRRTLGTRLAQEESLTPAEVMSQMRHRSIETTMKNYFRADVAKTARKFLKIKGCTLGCTPKPTTSRR